VYALSAAADNVDAALTPMIAATWSLPTALSLLAWFIYAPQCLSTIATIKRETNSWRYPLITLGYLFAMAYAASFLTYHVAKAVLE
jgi:ferrous iron transport protein B